MLIQPEKTVIERQVNEDDYREYFNSIYDPVTLGHRTWDPADVLKKMDPNSYYVGCAEYCTNKFIAKEMWVCPICELDHDNEPDAILCCQREDYKKES